MGLRGILTGANFCIRLGLAELLAASSIRSSLSARWRDPTTFPIEGRWVFATPLFPRFSVTVADDTIMALSTDLVTSELTASSLDLALIFDATSFTLNEIAARISSEFSLCWRGVDCTHFLFMGLRGILTGANFCIRLGLAELLAASSIRSSLSARWRDPTTFPIEGRWVFATPLFPRFSVTVADDTIMALSTDLVTSELTASSLDLALIFDATTFILNAIAARISSESTLIPADFISFSRISMWSCLEEKFTLFEPFSIFRAISRASAASLARLYVPR